MEHLKLSDGEWKLMKTLWAGQPQTLAELVTALDADTGWSRATIFMMLKRLIAKGAVTMDDSGKFQKYSAAITYSDVEPEETESFLSKVYGGSVGMMVPGFWEYHRQSGSGGVSGTIEYYKRQPAGCRFHIFCCAPFVPAAAGAAMRTYFFQKPIDLSCLRV